MTIKKKSIYFYDQKGKLIYKDDGYEDETFEVSISNIKHFAKWHRDMYRKKVREEQKEREGNYKRTKYGKIMSNHAKEIQTLTGDAVESYTIEKSDQSSSRYINFRMNTKKYENLDDTYTVRISDHHRKSYYSGGGWYDHSYALEIIVNDYEKVDWNYVVTEMTERINFDKNNN